MCRKVTGKDLPEIGQKIYIPTSLYLGHSIDDFAGGLCRIRRIEFRKSSGKETIFVEVEERQGHFYNWEYILKNQEEWAKRYEGCIGHPEPDFRKEFNIWE